MIELDGFEFRKSTRKNKKYDAFMNGKYIVSFGDKRYQQYNDRIGLYRHLNHLDFDRKLRYFKRFGTAKPLSAKWFSHQFLW